MALDCYAGSGATLLAAGRLGRRFVGMDDSLESHKVVARKLGGEKIDWQGGNAF